MRSNLVRSLLALAAVLAAGCASTTTQLVRLVGPEGKTIPASIEHEDEASGAFWLTLPDGEFLTGRFETTPTDAESNALLSTPWGPITTVSRSQAGPAVTRLAASGNRGTALECVAFPKGGGTVGGCRDSSGRLYTLRY